MATKPFLALIEFHHLLITTMIFKVVALVKCLRITIGT